MIKAIDPNQLLTQMRALQTQATQTGDTKAININNSADKVDFGDAMKQAVNQVNELQKTSGQMKTDFELGKSDVNLVDVMIASQKATVAFQATIQVRNKLVEAYQEVMRMSL